MQRYLLSPRAAIVLALVALNGSCGGSDGAPGTVTPTTTPVSSVTINAGAGVVVPGGTLTLIGATLDAGGASLAGRSIAWTSSAASVATVSAAGVVTGVSAGSATITATSEGKTATTTITVKAGGVVTSAGTTVSSADGQATLVFPAGAVTQPLSVTVAQSAAGGSTKELAGTAWSFGPDGTQFSAPVTVKIKYPVASVPANVTPSSLTIATRANGVLTPIPSTVDAVNHVVSANTTHFSEYTITYIGGVNFFELNDDGTQESLISTAATMCVGSHLNLALEFNQGSVGSTASSDQPLVAQAYFVVGGSKLTISALSPGTAQFTASTEVARSRFDVTVVAPPDPNCSNVTHTETRDVNGSPNVVIVQGNTSTPVTTSGTNRSPIIGAQSATNPVTQTPLAWNNSVAGTLMVAFDGTAGALATFPLGNPLQGGAFRSATEVLASYISPTTFTGDIWSFIKGGSATRLTNFGGSITGVSVAGSTMWYSWNASGELAHIYSTAYPTSALPVTTGKVALNPTTPATMGEFGAAVSPNGGSIAYSSFPANSSYMQMIIQSLADPLSSRIEVTTKSQYALSPTWCGNHVLYYVLGSSIGGPFKVMRWDRATGTSTVYALTSAINVGEIHFTRVSDDKKSVCPF